MLGLGIFGEVESWRMEKFLIFDIRLKDLQHLKLLLRAEPESEFKNRKSQ